MFRFPWLRRKRATRPRTSQADPVGHKRDLEHEFSAEERLERAEKELRRKEAPEELP